MASQLKFGEVGESCPLIRNAVQADMPVVVALFSCDAQLLKLHRHDKSVNMLLKLEDLPQVKLQKKEKQGYYTFGMSQNR